LSAKSIFFISNINFATPKALSPGADALLSNPHPLPAATLLSVKIYSDIREKGEKCTRLVYLKILNQFAD
jgi:hypothetical protein